MCNQLQDIEVLINQQNGLSGNNILEKDQIDYIVQGILEVNQNSLKQQGLLLPDAEPAMLSGDMTIQDY